MFVQFFNFTPNSTNKVCSSQVFALFFQQSILYLTITLTLFFVISLLLSNTLTKGIKFKHLFNFFKNVNILLLGFIFFFVFLKFIIYLWNYKNYGAALITGTFTAVKFNYLYGNPVFNLNGSILSDTIILLAFSSGLVCIHLLGEKNLSKYTSNINIFSIFLVSTILMVYTTNLLVMFVGFEMLFIPTLYFVYSHGYVERVDKTLKILLYWTLSGAFLVLTSLAYLFFKYKTLNFCSLINIKFTFYENVFLYMAIFFGFGVKVPVFPFHYWLTKIHVEAPAGFSIFLSGFLVKAAIYCFYFFNLIFDSEFCSQIITVIALFGVVESSIKMWTQTDFKKLIAFATIQEMNLILFLLMNSQNILDYSLILFILIHGWLSTLMFFWVDVIQKKTSSRNIVEVSGLAYTFPNIKLLTWFIIILFSGFPLTVKFVIEWQILGCLILNSKAVVILVFFVIVVIGVVGFAKQLIIILYGIPREPLTINSNMSKRDKHLFIFITFLLVFLNLINFLLG